MVKVNDLIRTDIIAGREIQHLRSLRICQPFLVACSNSVTSCDNNLQWTNAVDFWYIFCRKFRMKSRLPVFRIVWRFQHWFNCKAWFLTLSKKYHNFLYLSLRSTLEWLIHSLILLEGVNPPGCWPVTWGIWATY